MKELSSRAAGTRAFASPGRHHGVLGLGGRRPARIPAGSSESRPRWSRSCKTSWISPSAAITPVRCSTERNVFCWGRNADGQVGDGTTERPQLPLRRSKGLVGGRSTWTWAKPIAAPYWGTARCVAGVITPSGSWAMGRPKRVPCRSRRGVSPYTAACGGLLPRLRHRQAGRPLLGKQHPGRARRRNDGGPRDSCRSAVKPPLPSRPRLGPSSPTPAVSTPAPGAPTPALPRNSGGGSRYGGTAHATLPAVKPIGRNALASTVRDWKAARRPPKNRCHCRAPRVNSQSL